MYVFSPLAFYTLGCNNDYNNMSFLTHYKVVTLEVVFSVSNVTW